MDGVTQQEIDTLKSQVKEIVELAKKKDEQFEGTLKNMIQQVLANHPGLTPERKIEFPESKIADPERRVKSIFTKMPQELRQKANDCFIMSAILGKPVKELGHWQEFCEEGAEFKKALDTATAVGGGDWIPTNFTPEFFEFVRVQTKVAALFRTIPMPSNPYKLPIGIGRISTFKHDEQIADTGQTKIPVSDVNDLSANTVLTAKGHAARVLTSKDVEEDSIVPILPFLNSEIITAMAEGREDAILNGDTAGTHEDSDVTSASDRRKLWLGLRAMSNDQSYNVDLASFDLTTIRTLRSKMGKYGVMPSALAWITGIRGYLENLLSLAEVITIDKYGASATILSGELGKLDGIPLIVSEWVREDLNASAVFASGSTKTALHLVGRDNFVIGERRKASVQLLKELYAESDQDALVVRERLTFDPLRPIASNKIVYTGRNF